MKSNHRDSSMPVLSTRCLCVTPIYQLLSCQPVHAFCRRSFSDKLWLGCSQEWKIGYTTVYGNQAMFRSLMSQETTDIVNKSEQLKKIPNITNWFSPIVALCFQVACLSSAFTLTFDRCSLQNNIINPEHLPLTFVLSTLTTQPRGSVGSHGLKGTQVTDLKWGETLALFPSIRGFLNLATSAVLRLFS